eukprot:g6182.t1
MLQERDQCPVVYEDFDQAAEEIKALQSELTALKQHLQGFQKKLAAAQTEITSLKKDNSGLQVNLDAVQRSRKREADGYEKELGELRIELQKCKKEGEEWKRQVDSLSGDEAKTKQVLEEMERELDGAGEKIEEQRAEIARLRNARNRLTGESQTRLEAAKADYQASIERLKAQHAQQIEEMRKAHQAELEALKSTCNSELKAAETKATKAAEETERCTMKGGAGNIRHQNPSESRTSCARSCKLKANQAKSDNYLCTWGSIVLHTYPIRHCVIKGGAGKKKVDEPLTRYKCNVHRFQEPVIEGQQNPTAEPQKNAAVEKSLSNERGAPSSSEDWYQVYLEKLERLSGLKPMRPECIDWGELPENEQTIELLKNKRLKLVQECGHAYFKHKQLS